MNRKLLVTLLHKNIEELNVITEGFMEMDEYPAAIIHLARRKTEDIQTIIDQLAAEMAAVNMNTLPYINVNQEDKQVEVGLNPIESEIIDIQEALEPNDKEAVVEEETLSLPEEVEIPETKINIPAFVNLEENLNPELIIEDTEIIVSEPEMIVKEVTPESVLEEVKIEYLSENVVVQELILEPEVTIEKKELIVEEDIREKKAVIVEPTDEVFNKLTNDEHKRTIIAEKIIQPTVSRNEILAKNDNSLSASIANKKITDIKQAISIGDRFRFQRELFKGNGEEMNRTLNYINQLATFDEASSFLISKYGWDKANESVEDFLQLVRRRF